MLYEGITELLRDHLTKQCEEKIVPTFPPGGMLSLPAGVSLPRMHSTQTPGSKASSGKGKGKGRATEEEISAGSSSGAGAAGEGDAAAAAAAGEGAVTLATAASQAPGDRTDAAARAQAGERLLKAMCDVWLDHKACTKTLEKILIYVVSRRAEAALAEHRA